MYFAYICKQKRGPQLFIYYKIKVLSSFANFNMQKISEDGRKVVIRCHILLVYIENFQCL